MVFCREESWENESIEFKGRVEGKFGFFGG